MWRMGVLVVLSVVRTLAADPWEDVVARAREAARTDRNAESARLFQQAIETEPARRAEILRELADQLTYSGQAAAAVPLYREVIAAGSTSAEDVLRARTGLALALSWSGQLDESLRLYEALSEEYPRDAAMWIGRARVLSWLDRNEQAYRAYLTALVIDPENREAQRNLGRVASWRGRQREARLQLERFLRTNAEDAEALYLLGQSEYWLGRLDRAQAALGRIPRAGEEALRLRDEVARAQSDETRADFHGSTQSDDLRILRGRLRHLQRFDRGLAQAGVSFERHDYDPPAGQTVRVDRPGLSGRRRFSDAFEWNGQLFVDRIDHSGGRSDVLTFDTWATYWPDDFLRFDVSANRFVPDNILSLTRTIAATVLSVSGDFTPSENTRVNARLGGGDFTDGNNSLFASAEFERRILRRPRLRAGLRASAMSFDEQLGNGYFDPNRFLALAVTARISGALREGLWYGLFGAGGYETVDPGDNKPQYAINGNLSWQMTRRFQLELRADRFSSRQASSSGFARSSIELGIRYTPID